MRYPDSQDMVSHSIYSQNWRYRKHNEICSSGKLNTLSQAFYIDVSLQNDIDDCIYRFTFVINWVFLLYHYVVRSINKQGLWLFLLS